MRQCEGGFFLDGFKFETLVDVVNVDFGSVGILGSEGGAGVMSYLSYCYVSFPPLRQRNLLRRALAPTHPRPL